MGRDRLPPSAIVNSSSNTSMRIIAQRVTDAAVRVDGVIPDQITKGLLLLVGFEEVDQNADLDWIVQKLSKLRMFPDQACVMNCSVLDMEVSLTK